jgi:hypothetical protein
VCFLYGIRREKAGSLKIGTVLEYSTRGVQKRECQCKKSTLSDLLYLPPVRIPLMTPTKNSIHPSICTDRGIPLSLSVALQFCTVLAKH